MKKSLVAVAVVATLGLASCGGGADKAAEEACACVKSLVDLQKEAESLDEDDTEAAMEIMQEIQQTQEEVMICLEGVADEYKDKVEKEDLIKAMKEECPDAAKEMFD